MQILRGDVVWAHLEPTQSNEQQGTRPVLVLSHETFNQKSKTVIAVILTSQPQKAPFPLTFELNSPKLPKKSWVKISQIRTLSTERLSKKICRISDDELSQVLEGLSQIIG